MEFAETLFLIMAVIMGSAFLIFIYKFLPVITKKSQKKQVKDEINQVTIDNVRAMQESYQMQIVGLKKHTQGLQNTVNRLRAHQYDNENEEDQQEINLTDYEIDKEVARPFLSKWGMNADALDNPLLQGVLKEKFKDNTELMITLGILRPKGSNPTPSTGAGDKSNFDAEFQKLVEAGSVA